MQVRWAAVRGFRPDWAALVLLYALAAAVRLTTWQAPPYGDEAWHFYTGRRFGQDASHIHVLGFEFPYELTVLFWWRPLFEALLAPAAWLSFDAWRLAHLLLNSTLAPLGFLVVRDLRVRLPLSLGAALALALHPIFATWGVIVFPDGLLTTFVLASAWAWIRHRPVQAAAWGVAACWTKEVGLVGIALMGSFEFVRSLSVGSLSLRPFRVPHDIIAFVAAGILGVLPLVRYVTVGGKPPGWSLGGDAGVVLDQVAYTPWFAPILLLGLAWPRTRALAILASGYVAFWLLTHFALHRELQGWYFVLPSALVLLSVSATLDEAFGRVPFRKRTAWNRAITGIGVAVAVLLIVDVAAPSSTAWKGPTTQPFTEHSRWSLAETIRNQNGRVQDLDVFDVAGRLSPEDRRLVLVVDFPWYNVLYPMGDAAQVVRYGYSGTYDQFETRLELWSQNIETEANATILFTAWDVGPFHRALLSTYDDCIVYENGQFVLLRGRPCEGRTEQLRSEYARWKSEAAGAPEPS